MAIEIDLVTPEKLLFSRSVDALRAPGADGSFGVLPGHAPFVAVMEPGELILESGGESWHFFVGGGFVEVMPEKVIVLAESAEAVSEIDVDRAERALANAQERLQKLREQEEAARIERARVKRAAARIAIAKRRP